VLGAVLFGLIFPHVVSWLASMKAVMLMFDSLNRHLLSTYGCDWTVTPNFQRLAQRTVQFNTSYVCSMPCMPARRDLHTGRPNFLHRSWGPLEPWDDSVISMLREGGVHCHIATDHQHYWEEGAGGNYLTKYTTHAMVRGQEGDPFYGMIPPPSPPPGAMGRNAATGNVHEMDRVNRSLVSAAEDLPISQTFTNGMDFIQRHAKEDNWFVQIETFDPHEPFFTLPEHKEVYANLYEKSRELIWDWPEYKRVKESPDEVRLMRENYAALLTLCDHYVGQVIDLMDKNNLWDDTFFVVWTDHGFCLGEHDCWAKCWLPFYEEIARTPFFVWDPRLGIKGETRDALVQPAIDLGPTLLDFFGLQPTERMTGKVLRPVMEDDEPVRETALFGMFGAQVNVTDGRYIYMRGPATPENEPLFEYTLMPAHMRTAFSVDELQANEIAQPFNFTKGIRPVKIPGSIMPLNQMHPQRGQTVLFDLEDDPGQQAPVRNEVVEKQLCEAIRDHFLELDAPAEQLERLGL
jgi:arylsulfatase A-like enzyme